MEIGTKVLGFMPKNCDLDYPKQFIGKVGFIDAVLENSVRVNFGNKDSWWYNADEIYENIVSDECGLGDLVVKVKKLHPDSVISQYAKPGDAGLDLTAVSKSVDEFGNTVYDTGLAFEIPEGYVGLLFPRSSNAKTDLRLTNSVGVIDSKQG